MSAHFKLSGIWASAALLTGCMVDKTNSPGLSEFVNHCYVTQRDAIYLNRDCNPDYCDTLQPLDQFASKRGYPDTLQRFRDDPGGWSSRIREGEDRLEPPLMPGHAVVYGAIPAGTSLTVVQIVSVFEGENGRFYRTFATFDSGEFKGRRVVLPRTDGGVIAHTYLERCENKGPANN